MPARTGFLDRCAASKLLLNTSTSAPPYKLTVIKSEAIIAIRHSLFTGPAECAKRLNPPAHLWWCDERVERPYRKTLGKNSLLGINTGSAHSAGPSALGAPFDEGFTFFVLGRRRVHSSPFVFVLGRRRVHIFRRRAPKGSQFTLRSGL